MYEDTRSKLSGPLSEQKKLTKTLGVRITSWSRHEYYVRTNEIIYLLISEKCTKWDKLTPILWLFFFQMVWTAHYDRNIVQLRNFGHVPALWR